MPLKFITKLPATGTARLFSEKSEDSKGSPVAPGEVFVVDPTNEENDQDWVFGSREATPAKKGWMPMRFLREPTPGDVVRFPMVVKPFVRSCGRAELASVSTGEADEQTATTVMADYLLAWAYIENIESATDTEPFSNLLPNFEGSDAEGPFRLTKSDWDAYKAAALKGGIEISDFERLIPNSQVSGAAFKALDDAQKFGKLMIPGAEPADGPFVPSYLNVLHCHFLGVGAAHDFQDRKNRNLGSVLVSDALSGVAGKEAILKNRKKFMLKDDAPVTIDIFFELTSQALADGFKKALGLIREHADFLLPATNAFEGGAPWMKIAERELDVWLNLEEGAGTGLQKVIEYFKAVGVATDENLPWCGAFVGFCLQESAPSFKSTIVKEGAKASNWLAWGNLNMRQFDLREIPVGAIVVTHPLAEGTSGHVGFAAGKVPGTEKIVVLGGNQSDKVTREHVHKNKVRQIRWHGELAVTGGSAVGSGTDRKFANLLALIASRESNGNYNARFGKANNQNPKFTTMSIKAVRKWQDDFVNEGSKSSAVGKYQIIRTTLDGIIERLGLNGNELFDENTQDRMAINLLEVRKLKEFLQGAIDITQFGNLLAMEWASFPVLSQIKNRKSGRVVRRGQSYYAGDGLNAAHVMPEQVESALMQLK